MCFDSIGRGLCPSLMFYIPFERGGDMKRGLCGLFAAIGVLCIAFPRQITAALPYVLGGTMILAGVIDGIYFFHNRELWAERCEALANGFVLLTLGITCIVHVTGSIVPMGIAWAIIGLRKASRSLADTIRAFKAKTSFAASFLEFLIRMTCSVLLLFYPAEKFEGHIVLLGLELIAVSVRFTKQFFPVWDQTD